MVTERVKQTGAIRDFAEASRHYREEGAFDPDNFGEIPDAALAEIVDGSANGRLTEALGNGQRTHVGGRFDGNLLRKTAVIAAEVSIGALLAAAAGYGVVRGVRAVRKRKQGKSS